LQGMKRLAANFQHIRAKIAESAAAAGRSPAEITLVAVSKTFPVSAVIEARTYGQNAFGESRAQELQEKASTVDADWHFIGRLQRNKVRPVVMLASLIHAVDSESLLRRIDAISGDLGKRQALLLQANVSGEESKAGVSLAELPALLDLALSLPHVDCQGFMTMAPHDADSADAQALFFELRKFRDVCAARLWRELPVLSMGMSGDFDAAIAAGSTHVRLGRALFGERG
jgi:pyridoxal phosphate enzyme (YggS family)